MNTNKVSTPRSLLPRLLAPVVGAVLGLINLAATGATWTISEKFPLGENVVWMRPDPSRPWLYAIDQVNSEVLFIDLRTASVSRSIYVGDSPSDLDIDATGNFLYVANQGPRTGLYGSWRIGVVALTNQTLVKSYITLVSAVHVSAGRPGRLYYNNGNEVHSVDTDTGTDLGAFTYIKTRMVISSDKTHLFGQYVYTGNLGAMGDFDVTTDTITLLDTAYYSPYPYGWAYDNYSLSGDNRYLGYGQIMFTATNFADQLGEFPEQIYALNSDGSVAFGQANIWDTTTFPIHGNATQITNMPVSTTIMVFDSHTNVLYAFNPADSSIYALAQSTTHGIPFSWLTYYGLSTNDNVESQQLGGDGRTVLQDWLLDTCPTNLATSLRLAWSTNFAVNVQSTSARRYYQLQRSTSINSPSWQTLAESKGTGSNLLFSVSADRTIYPSAYYRVSPNVY
jgi:DNA-binding beta-propeller fold protein YncE